MFCVPAKKPHFGVGGPRGVPCLVVFGFDKPCDPPLLTCFFFQFNFYDHSKLILSSHGNLITHIDKHYKLTRWSLSEILAQSLSPPPRHADPEMIKFQSKLVDKLKYCKEVLVSIRNASANGGNAANAEEPEMAGKAFGASLKAALR